MAIPPIPPISASSAAPAAANTPVATTTGTSSGSFENILGQAIDSLNTVTNNATNVSLEAAAGNASVADATVASTEADLATQLTSDVVTKAVDAFDSIMNMQF